MTRTPLRAQHLVAFALIWITVAYCVSVARVQFFASAHPGAYTDAVVYLRMYNGESMEGFVRYRVLTPWLARLLPDGSLARITSQTDPPSEWFGVVKFALVNMWFLVLTAAALARLMWRLGFGRSAVLLGTLLFFTSFPVLQGGSIPMVDPASWFALALGMVAIQERRTVLLLAVTAIGMWAKETTVLLLPLALLSGHDRRTRLRLALATLPGAAVYCVVRFGLAPDPGGESYNTAADVAIDPILPLAYLAHIVRNPNALLDLLSSFGLLWIPAGLALTSAEAPVPLRRWSAFVPVLGALILLLRGNLGRILFLAFPVIIPLAVLTVERWLGGQERGIAAPSS